MLHSYEDDNLTSDPMEIIQILRVHVEYKLIRVQLIILVDIVYLVGFQINEYIEDQLNILIILKRQIKKNKTIESILLKT